MQPQELDQPLNSIDNSICPHSEAPTGQKRRRQFPPSSAANLLLNDCAEGRKLELARKRGEWEMHPHQDEQRRLDRNGDQPREHPPLPAWRDRRSFLKTMGRSGFAVASVLSSGTALLGSTHALLRSDRVAAEGSKPLVQPQEIRSQNGVLNATLTATASQVQIGDYALSGFLYNDAYLPPLLRVRRGDVMRITFRNKLPDDASNLHFHGMSVSPQANSDNVFIHVHPGEAFDYEVRVPAAGRQGPGLFWYHPHAHGFVTRQMLGGMSGGLVVDGSETLFAIIEGLPETFLFIKHFEQGDDEIISINGQLDPTLHIDAGEMQFWRIANIGATLFVKFHIEGMPLYALATDGHPLSQPRKMTEFFLGPGERIDAIAIGPPAGEYVMRTIAFQNQAWRKPYPPQQLATVIARSRPTRADAEAEVLRQHVDGVRWIDEVRSAPFAHRRRLEYSRTPDRQVFMIDGRVMDDHRIDQMVKLGDTEEWTVVNTDQQYHSFHIHQTPFLVTEVNGVRQDEDSLRDTFSIPPATDAGPGVLKVVIPFTDPVIVGRFVYHCHAVDHEDKGMMGVVEVVV
jgi:suppressor of ftsI